MQELLYSLCNVPVHEKNNSNTNKKTLVFKLDYVSVVDNNKNQNQNQLCETQILKHMSCHLIIK